MYFEFPHKPHRIVKFVMHNAALGQIFSEYEPRTSVDPDEWAAVLQVAE
jgi:hypothetical protein